jgi:transposase-like protein
MSETKAEAEFDHFIESYQAKYPKATGCLSMDLHVLLTFYDFPAEHWTSVFAPLLDAVSSASRSWTID